MVYVKFCCEDAKIIGSRFLYLNIKLGVVMSRLLVIQRQFVRCYPMLKLLCMIKEGKKWTKFELQNASFYLIMPHYGGTIRFYISWM